MFGWHSKKQRDVWGFAYMKTPSGWTVAVTMISQDMELSAKDKWSDITLVGEVTDLVQSFYTKSEAERAQTLESIDHDGYKPKEVDTEPAIKAAPKADGMLQAPACSLAYYGLRPCTCWQCPNR